MLERALVNDDRRRIGGGGWIVGTALAMAATLAVADDQPPPEPLPFSVGLPPRASGPRYTLRDSPTTVPAIELIEVLQFRTPATPRFGLRVLGDLARSAQEPGSVSWTLRYLRSPLSATMSAAELRADLSTGFSTRSNRDVFDLGVSYGIGANRIGLDYQLQSARPGGPGDTGGLSRFLPGSAQATHGFTLGVTRQFGAGPPPPPPPVLSLILETPRADAAPPPP